MRIGLLADIHANLSALRAAHSTLVDSGCEIIVNLGDAITIGPYPAETIEFIESHGILSIAGNHEDDLVLGFTPELVQRMGEGERQHYLWTHAQLSGAHVRYLTSLPHTLEVPTPGAPVLCVHYYLHDGRVADARIEVDRETLEEAFGRDGRTVAFGHTHHSLVHNETKPHFVNPGAAGLHHTGGPTVMIVETDTAGIASYKSLPVDYDPSSTLEEFDRRGVPDADYIRRTFFCAD